MSDDENIPHGAELARDDDGTDGEGSGPSDDFSAPPPQSSPAIATGQGARAAASTGAPSQEKQDSEVGSSRRDPMIGVTLKGTFRLVEKIGEGGMGNVYKALQAPLDREVAVKLLKPSENHPDGEHYFMREVQAINMLRHPNIIGILDFGTEEDGTLYLVMEYLPGKTLKRMIRKEFPLDPVRVCNICMQVLSALEQAHQTGIVHCDLKPANIMLEKVAGQDDFAKVLDFGIAKVKGPAMKVGPYTQQGNIVGTFDYMSPEQIMRKDLDGRADVWSMGVILYEMLTRKRIFHDKDAVSIIGRVMQMPIPRPSKILKAKYQHTIPPVLEKIALKAMERKIERRYQSAAEMREALKRALLQLEQADYGLSNDASWSEASDVHSASLGNALSESGSTGDRSGSLLPPGQVPGDTGRTGLGSVFTRSGSFGLGDSQRLATGIAQGTSVLDQTFSVEELQSSLTGERRKVAVLAVQQRARRGQGGSADEIARRSSREVALIREVVEHFDGEIDSFLGGTYTILFGAKKARVGDAVRAVQCALALRERFAGLEAGASHLGVGVAYGEIYVANRQGGNAFGEAIDRAVEIARGTRDGRVFCDEQLTDVTHGQIAFDSPLKVGGNAAAEAVRVLDASPARPAPESGVGADVYVPRPRYFEELSRRAASAKNRHGGGIAVLGELGCGKSTLLTHFVDALREEGWQAFCVRQDELESRQTLATVRAWIRAVAATYKDPARLIRKACESIGLTHGIDAVIQLYLQASWNQQQAGKLPWQDARSFAHFSAALLHRMIRFAMRKGPVLLAVDDVDVWDPGTIEILDSLLESIRSLPVLVVVTRRFQATERDHGLPGTFEILELGGLSEKEARKLAASSLGQTPSLEVLERLYTRSGGNPMFLAEMLRSLRRIEGTREITAERLEKLVPLSLHELLAQRVDDLSENHRDLLAIASVLGESFREQFFYQIAPAHMGPQLGLPELVKLDLLEARKDAFERTHVCFNPRALRRVVYERLPRETRQQFHTRVIEFLEKMPDHAASDPLDWSMSLAFHYKSVGGWEGHAYYLGKAGDVLLDMYDYPGAIAQYEAGRKALRERDFDLSNPTLAGLALKLLVALRESGRVDDAFKVVEELGDLTQVPDELHAQILLEHGRVGLAAPDPEGALRALDRVRDFALERGDVTLEIQALLALAQLFEKQNQLSHAGSLLMEVAQKVEQLEGLNLQDPEERRLYWTAYNQLGTLLIRQHQLPQAQQYLNNALRRARQINDHRGLIRVLSNLGALCLSMRDVAKAKEYFAQALQFARGTGDLLNQARILTNLGIAMMEANELEGSKKYFKQARTVAEEIGWHEGLADLALHIKRLKQALGG